MGYLVRNGRTDFYYVDYAARSGLFYQIHSGQTVRTKGLTPDALNEYAVAKDDGGRVHICLKNRRNQILHMKETKTGFQTEIILEDSENQYRITGLRMVAQKEVYLFYRAFNAEEDSYHIVCQQIHGDGIESEPQVIAQLPSDTSVFDVGLGSGGVYVITVGQVERGYSIFLHTFAIRENRWLRTRCLLQVPTEPESITFCVSDHGTVHVGYVVNQYGQHQLQYAQRRDDEDLSFVQSDRGQVLASAGTKLEPAMFLFNGRIWIHWKEPVGIRMVMSSDEGLHFSSSRLCTISQSAQLIYYIHREEDRLQGQRFYGVVSPQPLLAILHEIDTCGVFLERPREELRLVLEDQEQVRPCQKPDQEYHIQLRAMEEEEQRLLQQYQDLEEVNVQLREEAESWKERCFAAQARQKMEIKKREMLRDQCEDIPKEDIQQTDYR